MGIEENNPKDFKLKPMKCELNFLSKSDGSAILSQGETVTIVSVNGPLDIKTQSQSINKCTLDVLFSSKSGKPSVADRFKENMIRQTCEMVLLGCLYPRTGITVTIQELEDFGGLLSCALNCACLALLNSGVSMKHVFACMTCAVDELGDIVLDPPAAASTQATITAVFRSGDKSLITCTTSGSFSEDTYREAVARLRAASDLVFAFYREIVGKYSNVI